MKNYKMKPGIVLLSVDNEHLLVATREARDGSIPYVRQINDSAAFYWKLLKDGKNLKEMLEEAAEHFQSNKLTALFNLKEFQKKLVEQGYMIEEEIE